MNFAAVQKIERRIYNDLKRATGDPEAESFTWVEPTLLDLEVDREGQIFVPELDYRHVGDRHSAEVAVVYESEGPTLAIVHETATEAEVERLLAECMGLLEALAPPLPGTVGPTRKADWYEDSRL